MLKIEEPHLVFTHNGMAYLGLVYLYIYLVSIVSEPLRGSIHQHSNTGPPKSGALSHAPATDAHGATSRASFHQMNRMC